MMIGTNEIVIRFGDDTLSEIRNLANELERFNERATFTKDGTLRVEEHVHCGMCGREATASRFDHSNRAIGFTCCSCGCVGSRDDRGACGTVRWG